MMGLSKSKMPTKVNAMKLLKTLFITLLASIISLFALPSFAEEKEEVVYTMSVSHESPETAILFGVEESSEAYSKDEMAHLFQTPVLLVDWTTDISIELRGRELIRKSRI